MLSNSVKGIFYGCGAAICYGTNPLGALFLYREGLSPESVLCYRFATAIVLLALLMLFNRNRFAIKKAEILPLAVLGFLFAFVP